MKKLLLLVSLSIAHQSFADAVPGPNFDGSVNFENPKVMVDGAMLPVQQGSGAGYCEYKGLYHVSDLVAPQDSGTVAYISDNGHFDGTTTDTAYLSLAVCVSANATGPADNVNVGVVNFDGSITYDNPTLLVNSKQMPIVGEYDNFCYRKGMCTVTTSLSGPSEQPVIGIELEGTLNAWKFQSSSYVLQSVTCRKSDSGQNLKCL